MKISRYFVIVMIIALAVVIMKTGANATKPSIIHLFNIEYTISPDSLSSGEVILTSFVTPNFEGSPALWKCKECEITFNIDTIDNLQYKGPMIMTGIASKENPAVFELKFNIPENDTSGFEITIRSRDSIGMLINYFWVTTESKGFFHGNPKKNRGSDPTKRKPRIITKEEQQYRKMKEMEKTPLTEYSAQTLVVGNKTYIRRKGEYKFRLAPTFADPKDAKDDERMIEYWEWMRKDVFILDLSATKDYDFAKGKVDSLISTTKEHHYKVFLTPEQLDTLLENGIKILPYSDPDEEPPENQESSSGGDLLYDNFERSSLGNSWITDDLNPLNGIHIWKIEECPNENPCDGGYRYAWAAGYNQCSQYTHNIESPLLLAEQIYVGEQLRVYISYCINHELASNLPYEYDNCFFWYKLGEEWTSAAVHFGDSWRFPDNDYGWKIYTFQIDNPQGEDSLDFCFKFVSHNIVTSENGVFLDNVWVWGEDSPTVTVSGRINYWELGQPYLQYHSLSYFRVELWDYDLSTNTPRIRVDDGLTFTNNLGYFQFDPVLNMYADNDGTELDIAVRIFADNDTIEVKSDLAGQITYYYDSDVNENVGCGILNLYNIGIDTSKSDYFYVADIARNNFKLWNSVTGLYPGKHTAILNDSVETGASAQSLRISTANDPALAYPDSYDAGVIYHELAHKYELLDRFFDLNISQSHYWNFIVPPGLASLEGFAHFWASFSENREVWYDSYNNFKDTLWVNSENGEWGRQGVTHNLTEGSANAMGDSCEASVAGILWDIYDDNVDDYSGEIDWGILDRPHHPDNVKDNLNISMNEIMDVVLHKTHDLLRPETIEEFWHVWFCDVYSNGLFFEMSDIWFEHGLNSTGNEYTGDINFNGLNCEVSDAVMFVNYFRWGTSAFQGHEQESIINSNVNCDNAALTVADFVYLIRLIIDEESYRNCDPCYEQGFRESTIYSEIIGPESISINDTIRISPFTATTGAENIPLNIEFSNLETVSGLQARLIYDTAIFNPVFLDPQSDTITLAYELLNRCQNYISSGGVVETQRREPGEILIRFLPDMDLNAKISSDSEPIIRLFLDVKNDAPLGETNIAFAEDAYDKNELGDTTGASIFPTLIDGLVTIEELTFICGDANGDGVVDGDDPQYIIDFIFNSGPPPDPMEAADANCDGSVNVGDALYLIQYLQNNGPEPCANCP
ncbi:MAG: dockerin type I repeat-containing protein [candidate division Zixibacteria bacterium]